MKYSWKWLAAGLSVVVLGAAMAPWTFSGAALRQEIARQVRDTTGLITETDGRTTLALLPRPRIKVADVVIRDRDGKLRIESGMLRGDLRILPMLAGRMELNSVTLVAPQLDVDIDAKPLSNEGAIARASEARPASPEAATADRTRLGTISIVKGAARLHSATRNLDARIEDLDVTLDWDSLRSPAGLKANFLWNEEAVDVAAWIGRPADLLRGDDSPVSVKVTSPSLVLSANGSVFGTMGLRYQGKVSMSAPSLTRLAGFGGVKLPLPGPLKNFSLVGTAKTTSASISLGDMHMSVDGNAFDGALMLSAERGRPNLSGTLATDLLNLSGLQDAAPLEVASEAAGGQTLVTSGSDADLRVSATRVRIGRVQAKDVGLSLQINNGRSELTVAEAMLYGGLIKGRLRAEPGAQGLSLRANVSFARVDTASFLLEAFRSQRISGEATGDLALAAEGDSTQKLLSSLSGNLRATVANGELTGLDLEQALRRLEKRPLSIASEVRSGRTAFTRANVTLAVENGELTIRQADAQGPGVEFNVAGRASIPQRNLDLSIRAQTAVSGAANRPRPQLALDLRGNWDDPNLVLDTQSLIRRSEAAAPLLRSLTPPAAAVDEPAPESEP